MSSTSSNNQVTNMPNFRSTDFLREHISSILSFYYPQCLDNKHGGYFQQFDNQGNVCTYNSPRHLVSSSRLTVNFAVAAKLFNNDDYLKTALHGVNYLKSHHFNEKTGGYAWLVENIQTNDRNDKNVIDADNHCYGIAFVLMAYARTYQAGADEIYDFIEETYDLMEKHFWREQDQLYVDVIDEKFEHTSAYRGQNANMHCCEAMICAYEATGEQHYLDRALVVAHRITVELAKQCNGMIWEHYDRQWQVDFEYNAGDTENKLRPWGYQPGHFTEWTKLLLLIHKYSAEPWLVLRAKVLFDKAMEVAFDRENGGIHYGFDLTGDICSAGKYSWVQAETIAAAAMLATTLNSGIYECIYQQLWQYSWTHMIDHNLKCWHRNLTHDNKAFTQSSVAMGRTDYHSICACTEIISTIS